MKRLLPLLLIAACAAPAACANEDSITIAFDTPEVRDTVTMMRTFVFAADDPTELCNRIDPRGLPFGDAEQRTGLTALRKGSGGLSDTLAEYDQLAAGAYALAIEAWGPPCLEYEPSRNSTSYRCARRGTGDPTIMRAWSCLPLFLSSDTRVDRVITLETLAQLNSTMHLPASLGTHYDAMRPLPIADGELAHDELIVQLLDPTGVKLEDQKVRWTVEHGSAFLSEQPSKTSAVRVKPPAQDAFIVEGLSVEFPRAGATASSEDGGKILISAYAPGFEGSPVTFEARAVPNVHADLERIPLPRDRIALDGADLEFQPLLADDLDGDGFGDVVVVGGVPGSCGPGNFTAVPHRHRLGVLYGQADGTFRAAYSELYDGEVNALVTMKLDAGGKRALLVFTSDHCSGAFIQVTDLRGHQHTVAQVQHPRIEIWSGLDQVAGDRLELAPRIVDSVHRCLDGDCPLEPLGKMTIAADARDVDRDGIDELALSRCSWSVGGPLRVTCHAEEEYATDAEASIFRPLLDASGELTGFRQVAAIRSSSFQGGEQGGGLGEIRFADVACGEQMDLIVTNQQMINGVCGSSERPLARFGFDDTIVHFEQTIGFNHGYSVAVGRFNDDRFDDVVVGSSRHEASPPAGIELMPGAEHGFDLPKGDIDVGGRLSAQRLFIVRSANLNHDARDDVLVLHREQRHLAIFFGMGTDDLVHGPEIELATGVTGELAVYQERDGRTLVVTTEPGENAVLIERFTPALP